MGKFINPFTDVGFKRIFGQEVTKDLLIDFLNDLLVDEKCIKDIRLLDKEVLPEFLHDRGVIYDIYCTTDTGEQFIVEMQNSQQINFRERALYYMSRAVTLQGERGSDWKFNIKAVYGVFFMNFTMDGIDKFRTDVVLADRDTHEQFSDKLRFIYLQLPLFRKEESECETDLERWIYVLKNMETLNRLPFQARKAVFKRLESIVDIAALSKEERMKYDESIKIYRDHLVTMEFAVQKGLAEGREKGLAEGREKGLAEGREKGLAEGREKGLAEGREKGLAEGREKGLAEGRAEGRQDEKQQIARNLKSLSMPVETIVQVTGLSADEIELL